MGGGWGHGSSDFMDEGNGEERGKKNDGSKGQLARKDGCASRLGMISEYLSHKYNLV